MESPRLFARWACRSATGRSRRLLLALARPTAGRAEIFGLDAQRDAVAIHRRLAYVPGETMLWPSLTGAETLHLLGRVHGHVAPYRGPGSVVGLSPDGTWVIHGTPSGHEFGVAGLTLAPSGLGRSRSAGFV
jgi:hypothetical protein